LKRSHLAREIVETVALTLLIFLVIRFVVQSYHVEGSSMETNLTKDNYVLVNKVAYLFRTPDRGDVIVFHFPLDTTRDFIKRVIGLPGDVIKTDMTHVWVNGVLLQEPYVHQSINQSGSTWTVPANSYFVMGDNRPVSDDSRDWGFVPKDYVVGKAVFVYWPIKTLEVINTYPQVYVQIKTSH
jgi:signal peptidase I